jgi:hypothetical protein
MLDPKELQLILVYNVTAVAMVGSFSTLLTRTKITVALKTKNKKNRN